MDHRELIYVRNSASADGLVPAIKAAGWHVHWMPNVDTASNFLRTHTVSVGLASFDDDTEDGTGRDVGPLISEKEPIQWVALLHPNALHSANLRRLIWNNFYDYHTLPPDTERLLVTLGHAHGMAMVAQNLHEPPAEEAETEAEMVGVSEPMHAVFKMIRKIAAVDAPVLITGESGTGKELAARAVHERSQRAGGPFVAINCGALPPTLIQSELFGHEKGSFTGAIQRKTGSIESAAGGTVFLDEIGDLSTELQVNLLRFLQEGTIRPVGSARDIYVDARVIAATHVDLKKAVREKTFREDLYYRLDVLDLDMPPLRERTEDIEVLAYFFLKKFSKEKSGLLKGFRRDALQSMARHSWPGNVREIINRVRRATVMCEGRLITSHDLGLGDKPLLSATMTLDEARAVAEREAITRSLTASRSNLSEAARRLGVSRPKLYRLMERHGLTH